MASSSIESGLLLIKAFAKNFTWKIDTFSYSRRTTYNLQFKIDDTLEM